MRRAGSLFAATLLLAAGPQDEGKEVAALVLKLKSADPGERIQAEDALVNLGARGRAPLEKERQARPADLELAFRIDLVLRRITLLERPGASRAQAIAVGYANRGIEGRTEVIRQLAAHPDAEATAPLVEIARQETDPKVKAAAVGALGYRRGKEPREALEKLAEDASAEIRVASLSALRNIGIRGEFVARGLADPSTLVREAAAECVESLTDEAALPLLKEMLKETASGKTALRAVRLCRRFRQAALAPLVASRVKTHDRILQAEALTTLVGMKLPESAKALLESFQPQVSPENRETLRRGVIDAHHPSVLPELIEMLRSKSPVGRDMAERTLVRLSAELGVPGPQPKALAAATLKAQARPPDERVKRVVDGEWNEKGWLQAPPREASGTREKMPAAELEIELPRETSVHSIRLIAKAYSSVELQVSPDGKTFEPLGLFQVWPRTAGDPLVVNRKTAFLRFLIPRSYGHPGVEYLEVIVHETGGGDLVEEWQAWWASAREKLENHAAQEKHAKLLIEAQDAWESGDPKRGLGLADRGLKERPDCLRGRRLRGAIRQVMGDSAGAVDDLAAVTRAVPSDWAALHLLAAAHAASGNKAAALDALENAVRAGLWQRVDLLDKVFEPISSELRFKALLALMPER